MDDLSNVSEVAQASARLIDFGRNFPPPSPLIRTAIQESFSYLAKTDVAEAIRFPRFTGTAKDREAGANWLARRFEGTPDPDRIVLANGTQSILAMLLAYYVKPGGVLLTEALTYPAIKPLSQLLGVKLHGISIDAEGIEPGSLNQACIKLNGNARALYCMPTLHNPTSAIMTETRRQDIAKIARRYDLSIFEDDIYGVLPQKAPPPLSAYAPERSWYIMGLSKSLASQLRVAYVAGPSLLKMQKVFWPGVRTTNWMVAPLIAEIATHWLATGLAAEILNSMRVEIQNRRNIAQQAFGMPFDIDPASYHLWIKLPNGPNLNDFVEALKQRGVVVGAGDSFAVGSSLGDTRFRIGLGVAADHNELRKGLAIVSDLIKA
ncbi:aminotransferase class I/II-fold pyridoxal phosphate-dependent enzyme [Bradyrhizobium sp. CSA207]|uniref:aminotransferase-like domain-containing protein n=1 Tax=Bradyrhizobium sp. CSA207 TaxID=2698826 RepID=UPI0023B08863|nr:PLP-dependent aminotransferase family protein [Bradyrhizobium sp. CSA207]MDE5445202.1 aminotransferase class I/II-fold pyridoxal phosphate-dependent enzyme [Bradyrhizobium sp. CSA207]